MDEHLLTRLRDRRAAIRREWETLLRAEPVASALAHPDTLSRLIDRTLDEVFAALAAPVAPGRSGKRRSYAAISAGCECGRNPLLAYFLAGERALLEALVMIQAESRDLPADTRDRAVTELYLVFHNLARRELSSFCAFCQFKTGSAKMGAAAANVSQREPKCR